MKIKLKSGHEVIVDDADEALVSIYKWYVVYDYRRTARPLKSVMANRRGEYIAIHRLIMCPSNGLVVDHIDGNILDNRRCNLRLCSNTENARNSRRKTTNKSGKKGVYREGKRWVARIRNGISQLYLGSYDSVDEAHSAYCRAAVKFHGEFARFE